MTVLRIVGRAELRSRWRSWVGLGLLLGVVAGAVMAAAAGARRTERAYPRFLRAHRAADLVAYLSTRSVSSPVETATPSQIVGLPQVADAAVLTGFATSEPDVAPAVNADGQLGTSVNRFKLLSGRLPSPDRADEALVGFVTAERRHLHVGSLLTLHFTKGVPSSGARTVMAHTFWVVGIEAAPGEFPPITYNDLLPLLLSPAFLTTREGSTADRITAILLRLHRGPQDIPAFGEALQARAGPNAVSFDPIGPHSANIERSIRLQAVGLWLVAALAAAVGLAVVTQLLVRQISLSAADRTALRALGLTTPQLWVQGLLQVGTVAVTGAVSGAALAILLSPLAPIGVARLAEVRPGFAADAPVLALGTVATLFVFTALSSLPARLAAGRAVAAWETAPLRPSAVGTWLGRLGLPPAAAVGARLALEPGRGRSAVPVRSSLAAAVVSLGSLAAALTFVANSTYLLATPRLYGATFDADVQSAGGSVAGAVPLIEGNPAVDSLSIALTGAPVLIGGATAQAQTIGAVRGYVWPTLAEGRYPESPDEVLLGSETLRQSGAEVGGTVMIAVRNVSPAQVPMRVVGSAVVPPFGNQEELGRGVVLRYDALGLLVPPGFHVPPPDHVLVRLVTRVDRGRALARLRADVEAGGYVLTVPNQPTDLVNFGGVRALPLALASLMAVLGAATLIHLLASSVRRRRRELGILKVLGFRSRQVGAAVEWQATTFAAAALVIGVPLGVVAGRWSWTLLARQLGVLAVPQVPVLSLAIAVAATLALANVVALVPAAIAARLPVARVLREE